MWTLCREREMLVDRYADTCNAYAAGVQAQTTTVLYRAWQREATLSSAEVVEGVRAAWKDVTRENVEVTLALMERAGIARAVVVGGCTRWTLTDEQHRARGFDEAAPRCFTGDCQRLSHADPEHLPRPALPVGEDAPSAASVTLVLRHADYVVTWAHGSDRAMVWHSADDWDNNPDEYVSMIDARNRAFTPQALAELTASWLDLYPDALTEDRADQERRRAEHRDATG